jgi:hypothetical protein
MESKFNDIQAYLTNIISLDEYTSKNSVHKVKKDQLYRKEVPFLFLETLFEDLFDIKLDETIEYHFSKTTLTNRNAQQILHKHLDELKSYYIQCKHKLYLENLNEKKMITLLRQLLRTHEYELKTREKYDNGKKFLLYTICKKKIKLLKKINSFMNFD